MLPLWPGGSQSGAIDINDVGVIVGYANSPIGAVVVNRAVRWVQNAISDLGVFVGYTQPFGDSVQTLVHAVANGVGPTGIIVGSTRKEGNPGASVPERRGAFRWTAAGGVEWLKNLWGPSSGGLSTRFSEAYAVNGEGTAVGYSTIYYGRKHAVLWTADGTIVDLHPSLDGSSEARDINEFGWITGTVTNDRLGTQAVVWSSNGALHTLGTIASWSNGMGIHDSAAATVGFAQATGAQVAVRWPIPVSWSGTVFYPCPNATATQALEVSNRGRMVGWCNVGASRAWTSRNGTAELLPVSSVPFSAAYSVNGCGTVVGHIDRRAAAWTRVNTGGPSGAPVCDQ
jgi:probable HAF family extracellular repeat protein